MEKILKTLLRVPALGPLALGIVAYLMWVPYNEFSSVTLPMLDGQIQSKNAELSGLVAQVKKIKEFEQTKEQKQKEFNDLVARFQATRDLLPSAPDVSGLLKSLADIADQSGIEFSRFTPGPTKTAEIVSESAIQVDLRGTYIQIMGFLDAVANLKRVVHVHAIGLTPQNQANQRGVISASVKLVTFFIPGTPGAGVSGKAGG
jgi:Tfp pilus assembly protein PilO